MAEVLRERRGRIMVLSLSNPPVNGLGYDIRAGLMAGLEEAYGDDGIDAVVIAGAGRMFSGGADITEFNTPKSSMEPRLAQILASVENAEKPVVAALHGVSAGGGLELPLACHYRVAARATRLGLPEVTLGIIPGAGGTQRMPRLVGVEAALKLIVTGELVPVEKALALGFVDEVTDGDVVEAGIAAAERLAAGGEPRRTCALDDKIAEARGKPEIVETFKASIARRARGYEAPFACIEAVENAVNLPFDEGLAKEREIFLRLVEGTQSKALRHAFFAEREAQKIPDVPKDTAQTEISSAGVIGAGTMGGGIAMNFANAGVPVTLVEVEQDALDRGLGVIEKNYANTVAKGRLSQEAMDERMGLITGSTDMNALADADMVIEAVFENMDLKKEIFGRLDEICKPGAILTTNTSTLDVDEIAAATSRPEAVMGTHFFSPANVMKLQENVRGARTSKETIATVMALTKKIGKVGVLVGICDGFVGNRMLYAYSRQSNFLIEEGALPQDVDRVIYDFGFPMGPFAMGDLAGLDVGWRIRKEREARRPTNLRYSPVADRICEMGRFGQKTGAGWYRYEEGDRTPHPDPEIEELIVSVSKELGIERRAIPDEEILQRCMYPLINEGAKILDEGLALRASDLDVIWIYGYGFPRYRGGPMFYADTDRASRHVYDAVSRYLRPTRRMAWRTSPAFEKAGGRRQGLRRPIVSDCTDPRPQPNHPTRVP